MSAPTRLRHPSPGAVARGSAVGLGLLVASAAVAPAALATDDATDPVAPDTTPHAPTVTPVALNPSPAGSPAVSGPINASFGTGKQFDLALAVDGDTPADLDLAGARFALTAAGGTTAATCVTRTDGTCTVNYAYAPSPGGGTGSSVSLTDGTYTVTQVSAVDGLTPVSGPVGTVTMDYDAWHFGGVFIAPDRVPVAITDVAQYSRTLTAAVVDAAGNPLPDIDFALTGPAYPGAAEAYDSGTVTSDADGLLTFDGWFWPEHWTLTPLRVPAGSELGDPLLVVVPSTPGFHAPQTWAVGDPIGVLAPDPSPNGDEGSTGGDPSTPPTPPVVVPPSVVAPPAAAPSPAASRPRAVAPVAEDPTVPAPAPAPAAVPTATYDGRSSLPQEDRSPNTDPAPALLAAPQLQTASSSLSEVGLVGIGVLFVAVVAAGVVFLRRRVLRG